MKKKPRITREIPIQLEQINTNYSTTETKTQTIQELDQLYPNSCSNIQRKILTTTLLIKLSTRETKQLVKV